MASQRSVSVGMWTPHCGILRGEGMYTVKCRGATLVGVPEEHRHDLTTGLLELEINSGDGTADGPLTEGCIECTTVFYMDKGEHTRNCVAADNPETPVVGMLRQYESVVQREDARAQAEART